MQKKYLMPLFFRRSFFLFLCFCLSFSLSQAQPYPNILVIVTDDLGVDYSRGYNVQSPSNVMPTTPHFDDLRATGVTFSNAWAAAKCSPTRAALLSGKYGKKNGVQNSAAKNLDTSHVSIFRELNAQTNDAYATAFFGKWHISDPVDYDHPSQHGIDHYEVTFGSDVGDYYSWDKVVNGTEVTVNEYATTHLTNGAMNWINNQTQPWFLVLGHVAPHTPFHVPPDSMYTRNNVTSNKAKFAATIEAIDFDTGRLFDNIPPMVLNNTIIIYLGDNGSPGGVGGGYPNGHFKSTLYEGGVRVPFIVTGYGVTRQNEYENALVHCVDIYSTILEVAGINLPGGMYNSLSFDHLLDGTAGDTRLYNYTDLMDTHMGWAMRNHQYKLIYHLDNRENEFYDLLADSLELNNLIQTLTPAQTTVMNNFIAEAEVIRNNWSCQDYIQNGTEIAIDDCSNFVCNETHSLSLTDIGCCASPSEPSIYNEFVVGDTRYVNTNNYPNHDFCHKQNKAPEIVNFEFKIDATPTIAAQPSSILTADYRPEIHFGIGLSGVVLAPAPATPFIYEDQVTGEYNWDWVFEPTKNKGNGSDKVALDCSSAHVNGRGEYHYHGNTIQLAETMQAGISTATTPPAGPLMIGWAADGFPIVYRFGPDGVGGLKLLQPSHQLKQGERPGDGISSPCGPYNGKYTEDYEYVPGSGDLDECNGINRTISLTTPQGQETFDYFYVITDSFPEIGRCIVGTPSPDFLELDAGRNTVYLEAKVMLDGPYDPNSGLMDDNLRTTGYFPTSEPFTALGYEAIYGENIIDPAVLMAVGDTAVVDWILVELRHQVDSTLVLDAQPGLLLRNGRIVDLDGYSPLALEYTRPDNYYIAIHHRNHLSIMSNNPFPLTDIGVNVFDFTDGATPVYGTNARKDDNGVFVLWAGDATGDGTINAADRSETWNNRNITDYLMADVDLSGSCNAADRSITWNNRNTTAQLP